jgi:hypothetical protein
MHLHVNRRLGIELTKIMVLQYSNQETSVTIGESVRDEDGTDSSPYDSHSSTPMSDLKSQTSIHPPVHPPQRHQRRPNGTSNHDQRL